MGLILYKVIFGQQVEKLLHFLWPSMYTLSQGNLENGEGYSFIQGS